jgi:hypothetical protein
MDSTTISEDFKLGYIRALADVFHVLMDNMDEEVENRLLTELKLKKV